MADPGLSPALVRTAEAKALLERPLFVTTAKYLRRGTLGGHIAVNGYDLARVEKDAYDLGFEAGTLAPGGGGAKSPVGPPVEPAV